MKRFRFQLDPVLDFKQQTLDALMVELNTAQAQVMEQQKIRDDAYGRLADYENEYREKKQQGLTVMEAMECQGCQQVLERRARREDEKLERLKKVAERKRQEVVNARMETHSLEKLKDVRRDEYNKAVAKAEEKNLDDLTAARRAAEKIAV